MTIRLQASVLIRAASALALFPSPAEAGCAVSAQDLPFGALAVSAFHGAATSAVTVTCPPGLPTDHVGLCLKIATSAGGRTMKDAAGQSIAYGVYHDAAHSIPWLGASETLFVSAPYDTKAGSAFQQMVYARILSDAAGVSQGLHSDVITAQAIVAGESGYDGAANVCNLPQTASVTFHATATVQPSCSVRATDMTFPAAPSPVSDVSATAQLNVVCTGATPYEVGLSAGSGAGATIAARKMTGPDGATLTYSLFRDAAYKMLWGDTPGARATASGAGAAQTFMVHGLAPRQPLGAPGHYADVISVTVTY